MSERTDDLITDIIAAAQGITTAYEWGTGTEGDRRDLKRYREELTGIIGALEADNAALKTGGLTEQEQKEILAYIRSTLPDGEPVDLSTLPNWLASLVRDRIELAALKVALYRAGKDVYHYEVVETEMVEHTIGEYKKYQSEEDWIQQRIDEWRELPTPPEEKTK